MVGAGREMETGRAGGLSDCNNDCLTDWSFQTLHY